MWAVVNLQLLKTVKTSANHIFAINAIRINSTRMRCRTYYNVNTSAECVVILLKVKIGWQSWIKATKNVNYVMSMS